MKKTKGQFYLTGSQSLKLMKNVSDSLAGRAGVIKLMGLSMRETGGLTYRVPFIPTEQHMKSIGLGADFDFDSITSFIYKWSFLELHETESDLHDWADFHSSYLQTYIEKDIRDVLNIKDESAFIKFVKAAHR